MTPWQKQAHEKWPDADWGIHPDEDGNGRYAVVTPCVILTVRLFSEERHARNELESYKIHGCYAEPCDPSSHYIVDLGTGEKLDE